MAGKVVAIYIGRSAGERMESVQSVLAIAGAGLQGDRYCVGNGSFNRGVVGKRQVTLMNAVFFSGSGFTFEDSRRNIFTEGVELMGLIGNEFQISSVRLRGVKYCDPCKRPSALAGKTESFQDMFFDRGGLVAEVVQGGIISVGSAVVPPDKGY